jgi:hypothetical protein
MLPSWFVIVGAGFNVVGLTSYVRDTVQGRTHPNRVTWALWALAPLIAFAAEIGQGVGLVALMTFMVGFGPLVVLIASFIGHQAYARITRFDLCCGALSVLAIVAWQVTGKGTIAILFSLFADLLAAIPTLRKAFVAPHTESWMAFLCSAISALLTVLTITDWTFAVAAFPIYIVAMSALLFTLVRFPHLRPASSRVVGQLEAGGR